MAKGNKNKNKNKGEDRDREDADKMQDSEPTTMDNTTMGDATAIDADDSLNQDPQLTAEQLSEPHNHLGADMGSYKEPEVHEEVKEEPEVIEKKKEEIVELEIVDVETPKHADEVKPEELAVQDHKVEQALVATTHDDSNSKATDNTSSFVQIGDSIAPQEDHQPEVVKDIQTLTPPADTPKDIAGRDISEQHVPENTPIGFTNTDSTDHDQKAISQGGEPERKTSDNRVATHAPTHLAPHHDDHHASVSHSPIPEPPIPQPPIPQPPEHVDLVNDKQLPHHDTPARLFNDKDIKKAANDGEANSSLVWGLGFAAVGIIVIAALKWKKVL